MKSWTHPTSNTLEQNQAPPTLLPHYSIAFPTLPHHYPLTFSNLPSHYPSTSPTLPPHYPPTFPPCHLTTLTHIFHLSSSIPSSLSHLPSSPLYHFSQLSTLPTTNRSLQNSNALPVDRQGKHVRLIVSNCSWKLAGEMLPSHSGI